MFIPLILATMTAFAQNAPPVPYTLKVREANYFRTWTAEELKSKITVNQDAIELNTCNGNEKLLLPDLVKSNPKKDSLKILNSRNNKLITYIDGVLTDHKGQQIPVTKISDSYTKAVLGLLEKLSAIPEGKRLISLLQQGLYPITLAQTGGPRFEMIGSTGKANSGFDEATVMQHFSSLRRSADPRVPFQQFGAGGFVRFDPEGEVTKHIESDNVTRPGLALTSFAHELFHSFDSVRGLMDRRGIYGDGIEGQDVAEHRAVYFENLVRKNIGRKYRKYYGEIDLNNSALAKESMLDSNGQPYLIPTPCLNK